jgi:hypothetical protein
MPEFDVGSVAEIAADLPGVLHRFRVVDSFAFSFGDGRPEAVLLTYDQFEDLDGERRFRRHPGVVSVQDVAGNLVTMVEEMRAGTFAPVVWGDGAEPAAVLMSTAQYRDLRGDDHPPEGVDDDPTRRSYASQPMPESKPFDLDAWAAEDPLTREILDAIRAEKEAEARNSTSDG